MASMSAENKVLKAVAARQSAEITRLQKIVDGLLDDIRSRDAFAIAQQAAFEQLSQKNQFLRRQYLEANPELISELSATNPHPEFTYEKWETALLYGDTSDPYEIWVRGQIKLSLSDSSIPSPYRP